MFDGKSLLILLTQVKTFIISAQQQANNLLFLCAYCGTLNTEMNSSFLSYMYTINSDLIKY